MAKLNIDGYKSERAKELSSLAKLLKSAQVLQNVKPIEDAASQCMTNKPTGKIDSWGYAIKDLLFQQIEDIGGIRPKTLSKSTVNVSLDVVFAANCVDHKSCVTDWVSALEINMILADKDKKYMQSWHFDRHIQSKNDRTPIAAHPIYHFQSGGRHIQGFSDDVFGGMLFVEGPRIAHPPLDGILAIDFVLSNYFGTAWRKLCTIHEYQKLVEGMQQKIWKPYVDSFHSTWQPPTGVYDWDPIHVMPQIVRQLKDPATGKGHAQNQKKKK